MVVRLSDPSLAEELLGHLRRADCAATLAEVGAHVNGVVFNVEVPAALDEHQARLELGLYLRTWEAVNPGSGAELLD
jgi:hypothetical protein